MEHLLAIDTGTTTLKVGAFSVDGHLVASESRDQPLSQHQARCEQSPSETLDAIRDCTTQLGTQVDLRSVIAIAVSVQRGTAISLDAAGAPITPYITWMDRRGRRWVDWLAERIGRDRYYELSGHPIVPITGITKLLMLRADASVWERTAVIGTQATHVLAWLGADELVCDRATASYHFPLERDGSTWNRTAAELIDFPLERLPRLVDSVDIVGAVRRQAARDLGVNEGTPLVAGGGDGQCAAAGAGCVKPGIALVNVGTAAGVQVALDAPARDPHSVLNCAAHVVPRRWEMEGHSQASGVALRWFRDAFRARETPQPTYDELIEEASDVPPGADGLTFLPTFNGATAPRVMHDMRAAVVGLALTHDRRHITRALLEGVCCEIRTMLDAVEAATQPAREIRVTGGASKSRVWMQILSSALGRQIRVMPVSDAALVGAAMCAAVGIGASQSFSRAAELFVREDDMQQFEPVEERAYRDVLDRYLAAFQALAGQAGGTA